MAPKNQDIPSFDDMIQAGKLQQGECVWRSNVDNFADRLRRKNEELANEIFGRGRKQKSNGNSLRNFGSGPSLASRVGIAKVACSTISRNTSPDIPSRLHKDQNRTLPYLDPPMCLDPTLGPHGFTTSTSQRMEYPGDQSRPGRTPCLIRLKTTFLLKP